MIPGYSAVSRYPVSYFPVAPAPVIVRYGFCMAARDQLLFDMRAVSRSVFDMNAADRLHYTMRAKTRRCC